MPGGTPARSDSNNDWRREAALTARVAAIVLEGAIYAVVKAATQRASAQAFEHSTGVWPGEKHSDKVSR
jgi:hypothetical protein